MAGLRWCFVAIFFLVEGAAFGQQAVVSKSDTTRVNQLYQQADELIDGGNLPRARDLMHQAKKLSDSLNYEAGKKHFYYTKANLLLSQRKADSAKSVLQKGINRFPGKKQSADLYSLLGWAYSIKGDHTQALDAYAKAIARIDSTQKPLVLAHAKFNAADSYYQVGEKDQAFRYYLQSIKLAEQAQDSTFLAVVLNNVGYTYNYENEHKIAAYYLKRARKISRATGSRINLLRATTNLGNAEKDSGHLDKALKYYHKSMQLSEELRPNSPPMIILNNLGSVYLKKGDLNRAENNFKESLKYSRKAHITPGVYFNAKGLSKVAERRGNLEDAVRWADQQQAAATKIGNPEWIQKAEKSLYLLNKRRGNYEGALAHLESLKTFSDSLQNQRYQQKMAQNKSKLEVERQKHINTLLKQRDAKQKKVLATQRWLIVAAIFIIVLVGGMAFIEYRSQKAKKRSIRLLRQKQVQLEALNEEKNRLFAIVAHDIRNPMSAMQGMLYLLRNENLSRQEEQEMMAQLEISMSQNLNMMKNLLAWAQQQLSGLNISLADISMKPLIVEQLADRHFEAEEKEIELSEHVPEDLQVHADRDLVDLVVRNLVGNAVKFCQSGDRIQVDACKENSLVKIQVMDTGIGIPADQQRHIFSHEVKSRAGTNNEKGSGLGLNLCKKFVEAQGGQLTFESEQGRGTTFTFTLPAAG